MRRAALCCLLVAGACSTSSSDRAPAAGATVSTAVPHDSVPVIAAPWPEALGPTLALANVATGDALLFRRDTLQAPARLTAFGYDSVASAVTVRDVRPLPCAARSVLRLTTPPPGWTLALEDGRARPLAIDALEDITPRDSQRVVVRIQRALNTLSDTGDALEFRGLPVVVRDAWLLHGAAEGVIVARAARLRNLEATAHEELRFIVLEGDQLRFVSRVAGDEETVESWELLASLDVHGVPWLAVAREGTGTLQLELLARDSTSAWRSVWRSDALSCGAAKPR